MSYPDTYPIEYKNYSKFPNSTADKWLMFIRQCTSYCAAKLDQAGLDIGTIRKSRAWASWNANLWDDRARELGVKVDRTPKVGAIAQWESTHVAYVEKVNGDGTIDITEYNWNLNGKFGTRTIKASNPSNFIHFKDQAPTIAVFEPSTPVAGSPTYNVTVTTPRSLKVRLAPSTLANIAKDTGTKIDGLLSPGDMVKGCYLVKGDSVDGINGWYRSQKGRYFWSGGTDQPRNL